MTNDELIEHISRHIGENVSISCDYSGNAEMVAAYGEDGARDWGGAGVLESVIEENGRVYVNMDWGMGWTVIANGLKIEPAKAG